MLDAFFIFSKGGLILWALQQFPLKVGTPGPHLTHVDSTVPVWEWGNAGVRNTAARASESAAHTRCFF
jgi:hypothetical protein